MSLQSTAIFDSTLATTYCPSRRREKLFIQSFHLPSSCKLIDLRLRPSMQHLSESSFQAFLGKEWLVKTNSTSSTPYLFKFVSSSVDLTCCALFTDTKSVWTEELTSQQLARRWRQCNHRAAPSFLNMEDEDEWRISILDLLAKVHTLGGVNAISFEVVNTSYSDIAFALECDSFKWRWEACFVGHKASADIISKQLILPLISMNHLLFSSAEPVQDMTDVDAEKAVDKIGRTARRAIDTHIKNVLAKPRISTILRRMTAMFNSLHDLPSIISSAEEPDLHVPPTKSFSRDVDMDVPPRPQSPMRVSPPRHSATKPLPSTKADSATESSADEDEASSALPPAIALPHSGTSGRKLTPGRSTSSGVSLDKRSVSPALRGSPVSRATSHTRTPERQTKAVADADKTSGDDSSPLKPPPKKARPTETSSSESDSESERRARIAQLKGGSGATSGSGGGGGAVKRGVRQPIKRGGKRF